MKALTIISISILLILFTACKKESSSSSSKDLAWLKQDLLLYYPFNGNAKDSSGNGYDGIVNGAILATDKSGKANCAYSFTNGEIISNIGDQHFTGNVTLSMWLQLETFNFENEPSRLSYPHVVSTNFINSPTFLALYFNPSSPIALKFYFQGPNNYYELAGPVGQKQWNYFTITNKSDTTSLYINGNFVTRTFNPKPKNPLWPSSFIRFGWPKGQYYDLFRFNGRLDEIRVYKRALKDEEIKYLYQN